MKPASSRARKTGSSIVTSILRKIPVRVACGGLVACVVYLSAQAYLAFPSDQNQPTKDLDVSATEDSQPKHVILPRLPTVDYDHPRAPRQLSHRIKRGDTLGHLLADFGTNTNDINRIVACGRDCHQLQKLIPGNELTVRLSHDDRLLEVAQSMPFGQIQHFHFYRDDIKVSTTQVERESVKTYKRVVIRHGESPISAALRSGGIKEGTVVRATQILEYDIDFWRNVYPDDEFEIYFDQIFVDDEHVQDGNIYALRFINRGKLHEAYRHADGMHYEADGSALQKQFLKAPLRYKRISSNFSNARKHPILGYTRAHRGVDYAAPRGTPIRSTADGVVSRVVHNDRAAGNFLAIRHANGFQTRYMHLSGFASGIRKGTQVSRGSTIGYVGSTGLSTGPHLHYEVIQGGRHLNPLSVPNPSLDSLEGTQRQLFLASVQSFQQAIAKVRDQNPSADQVAITR